MDWWGGGVFRAGRRGRGGGGPAPRAVRPAGTEPRARAQQRREHAPLRKKRDLARGRGSRHRHHRQGRPAFRAGPRARAWGAGTAGGTGRGYEGRLVRGRGRQCLATGGAIGGRAGCGSCLPRAGGETQERLGPVRGFGIFRGAARLNAQKGKNPAGGAAVARQVSPRPLHGKPKYFKHHWGPHQGHYQKEKGTCGDQPQVPAFSWSGREDLNLRHSAPKADALPGCATPRRECGFVPERGRQGKPCGVAGMTRRRVSPLAGRGAVWADRPLALGLRLLRNQGWLGGPWGKFRF